MDFLFEKIEVVGNLQSTNHMVVFSCR